MSHTPGPWTARKVDPRYDSWQVWSHGGDEQLIFDTFTEDNARLIAAAPDLLEALQTVLAWLPAIVGSEHLDLYRLNWHVAAEAAIAKATGEAP